MNAENLSSLIGYVFGAHSENPTSLKKAVRKGIGKTPYGVHPTWCAMSILAENALPESIRTRGAEALLLHDILEDTTAGLPDGTSEEVRTLVEGMTFADSSEEMVLVWNKSPEVRLLKLYDKVNNLMDGEWMSPEKCARYREYTLRLCADVCANFGELNITKFARAICQETT